MRASLSVVMWGLLCAWSAEAGEVREVHRSELEVVQQVAPEYPASVEESEERVCIAAIRVDPQGATTLSGMTGCEDWPQFELAARAALLQWRWVPYEVDGQPVAVSTRIPVRFEEKKRPPMPVEGGVIGAPPALAPDGTLTVHHSELTILKRVAPVYPVPYRGKKTPDVRCMADVVIGLDGAPSSVEVREGCDELFQRATVEALEQWRWEPVVFEGELVRARVSVGVNFKRR